MEWNGRNSLGAVGKRVPGAGALECRFAKLKPLGLRWMLMVNTAMPQTEYGRQSTIGFQPQAPAMLSEGECAQSAICSRQNNNCTKISCSVR